MGKERNKEEHKGMGGKSMREESLEMDGRDREREGENSNNVNNSKWGKVSMVPLCSFRPLTKG